MGSSLSQYTDPMLIWVVVFFQSTSVLQIISRILSFSAILLQVVEKLLGVTPEVAVFLYWVTF